MMGLGFYHFLMRKKLKRIKEVAKMKNVFADLEGLMGKSGKEGAGDWRGYFGKNRAEKGRPSARANTPVILELGCGAGAYVIALAQKYPKKNFIGIDRKGDRVWRGATKSLELKLKNVFFIQARVEHLGRFFKKSEVDEIWITFPDPYPKPARAKRRLTSPRFSSIYKTILKKSGKLHLKTDNLQLFEYSLKSLQENKFKPIKRIDNVHSQSKIPSLLKITTYYEARFLKEGKPIYYAELKN